MKLAQLFKARASKAALARLEDRQKALVVHLRQMETRVVRLEKSIAKLNVNPASDETRSITQASSPSEVANTTYLSQNQRQLWEEVELIQRRLDTLKAS